MGGGEGEREGQRPKEQDELRQRIGINEGAGDATLQELCQNDRVRHVQPVGGDNDALGFHLGHIAGGEIGPAIRFPLHEHLVVIGKFKDVLVDGADEAENQGGEQAGQQPAPGLGAGEDEHA